MKKIKLFKKTDLIVVAVVLLIALALFIPSLFKNDRLTAEIFADGKIIETIELDEVGKAYKLTPKDGTEIEVDKGRIRFCSACCKDELCIKSGWLDKNGQTAACLPERIVISIRCGADAPDMLTY